MFKLKSRLVCIILIFIVTLLFGNLIKDNLVINETMKDFKKLEDECTYTEDSIKYPVMGPNIPVDPHELTKIGYNLNTVIEKGNYMVNDTLSNTIQLRKPLLKYDGIYTSIVTGNDNIERQVWRLDESKDNMGVYGDDRLLQ